jgi:hypothetical protein
MNTLSEQIMQSYSVLQLHFDFFSVCGADNNPFVTVYLTSGTAFLYNILSSVYVLHKSSNKHLLLTREINIKLTRNLSKNYTLSAVCSF